MKKCTLLIVLLLVCGMLPGCSKENPVIAVGAKDWPEQYILGKMLVLLIENSANLTASYTQDLSSDVIFAGIRTGIIDVYIDYTGTIFGSYLNRSDSKCPGEVFEASARELRDTYNLRLLDPLGFNNTFSMAVAAETAAEHNLRTFSDLARVSSDFVIGSGAEFLSRSDGLPNLKRLYGLTFKEERVMVDVLDRYIALANGEVQVTEAFSTDGMLVAHDLAVLEDDKNFFPPYEAAILIHNNTADKHPELLDILMSLSGAFTDDIMRGLNYKAEVLGESPQDVAEEFLRENGFIR
jgi:glycine betaine/choline ABC-type transport system substrate-binding protein